MKVSDNRIWVLSILFTLKFLSFIINIFIIHDGENTTSKYTWHAKFEKWQTSEENPLRRW